MMMTMSLSYVRVNVPSFPYHQTPLLPPLSLEDLSKIHWDVILALKTGSLSSFYLGSSFSVYLSLFSPGQASDLFLS